MLLAAGLGWSPAARAADAGPEPIAVLGLEAVDLPEELGQRVTVALRDALGRRPNVQAMPGKDLMEMRLLFGCTEDANLGPCLAQAGHSLVVNRLVFGSIREATIGDKKTGSYFVRLRVLDVNSGVVAPTELHETVTPEQIQAPKLADTADRWLAILIGGAPPLVGGQVAPERKDKAVEPEERPGRRLLIGGIVAAALGVAAIGLSVYTYTKYNDLQGSAHDELAKLAAAQPAFAQANKDFFLHPTCDTPPTPAISTDATGAYTDVCHSGQSYASATTALVATGTVLGALGIGGIAYGVVAGRKDASAGKSSAARSPSPSIGASPGGLAITF